MMKAFSEAVSYVQHSRYQHAICIIALVIPLCALSEVVVFVLSELFFEIQQREFIAVLLVAFFFSLGSANGTKPLALKHVHHTKDAASEDECRASRQGQSVRGKPSHCLGDGNGHGKVHQRCREPHGFLRSTAAETATATASHAVLRSTARLPRAAGSPMESADEVPRTLPKVDWFETMRSDSLIVSDAQRDGFTLDPSNFPTVFAACSRLGSASLSIVLLKYMLEKGIDCDQKTVNETMVSKFFNNVSHSLDDEYMREVSVKLIELIRAHGLAPSSAIQNRLIRAWGSKLPDHIVQMFMTLRKQGVSLSPTAYRCILSAFERTQPHVALTLKDEMVNRGVNFDRVGFNAVLCACSVLGKTSQAVKLYEMMPSLGLFPNGKTYGLMIRVYTAADMANEALSTFEKMRTENIEPNRYAFDDAINCYVKAKLPEKAISLYQEMIRTNVNPREDTAVLYQGLIRATKTTQDAGVPAPAARKGAGALDQSMAALPARLDLRPGSKITVLSPAGMLRECTVKQVDAEKVRVCYESLDSFQVEWLPRDSSRIVTNSHRPGEQSTASRYRLLPVTTA